MIWMNSKSHGIGFGLPLTIEQHHLLHTVSSTMPTSFQHALTVFLASSPNISSATLTVVFANWIKVQVGVTRSEFIADHQTLPAFSQANPPKASATKTKARFGTPENA
jgi:hypothetical protein